MNATHEVQSGDERDNDAPLPCDGAYCGGGYFGRGEEDVTAIDVLTYMDYNEGVSFEDARAAVLVDRAETERARQRAEATGNVY